MSEDRCCAAIPHETLIKQLRNYNIPKGEIEYAALREIENLETELTEANKRMAVAERFLRHFSKLNPQWEELQAFLTTPTSPDYVPKTELGKELLALRNKAISKGMTLLNADEIIGEDHVLVPSEDLRRILDSWVKDRSTNADFEAYNRCEAALCREDKP